MNQWTNIFRSLLFKDIPWSKWTSTAIDEQCCTWRAFYYRQLGLPSKTWLWLLTDVIKRVHLNEHLTYARHQDGRWVKAALKEQSHIVIFWNMVIDRSYHITALNKCRKGHQPWRLTMGQFVLKLNVYFTVWVWVIKATSLMRPRHFFSQSD